MLKASLICVPPAAFQGTVYGDTALERTYVRINRTSHGFPFLRLKACARHPFAHTGPLPPSCRSYYPVPPRLSWVMQITAPTKREPQTSISVTIPFVAWVCKRKGGDSRRSIVTHEGSAGMTRRWKQNGGSCHWDTSPLLYHLPQDACLRSSAGTCHWRLPGRLGRSTCRKATHLQICPQGVAAVGLTA